MINFPMVVVLQSITFNPNVEITSLGMVLKWNTCHLVALYIHHKRFFIFYFERNICFNYCFHFSETLEKYTEFPRCAVPLRKNKEKQAKNKKQQTNSKQQRLREQNNNRKKKKNKCENAMNEKCLWSMLCACSLMVVAT